MIMKFGTGTVTLRNDADPDAPLAKTARLTEAELDALVNEEPVEED